MANHYPTQACCDCALVNECDPCDNRYACGYDGMDYNDYLVESTLRAEESMEDLSFHKDILDIL